MDISKIVNEKNHTEIEIALAKAESKSNPAFLREKRVREIFDYLLLKTENKIINDLVFCGRSPIEKILYLCLCDLKERYLEKINGYFTIVPQQAIVLNNKRYIPDFWIEIESDEKKPLYAIVECDGHNFHEKTKEQAKKDKQRDRDFIKHGYHVLRYTGTEIYRDPVKCASEIYETLIKLFNDKNVES